MASALYSRDILRLAAALVPDDRLENPDTSAERRSPTCGSVIAVDLNIDADGAISAIALRANACALGQASAAILRAKSGALTRPILQQMRQRLADFLGGADITPELWPEYASLIAARDYPARHAAILLPLDACIAALE